MKRKPIIPNADPKAPPTHLTVEDSERLRRVEAQLDAAHLRANEAQRLLQEFVDGYNAVSSDILKRYQLKPGDTHDYQTRLITRK